ncbi:MAG: hypothetical protein V4805_08540 [Pseudomonadota bacterium]
MRNLIIALAFGSLGACSSGPVIPDWKMNAHGAIESSVAAHLLGNATLADAEFARAKNEVAGTGRPDLLARVILIHCAAQVASLELDACADFGALAVDATAADRAYAQFLAGRWDGLDPALLPEQYRAVFSSKEPVAALAGMADPLSRLIASAALFQRQQLPPAGVAAAVASASDQGWRRPLLAWLGVQAQLATAKGDTVEAGRVQRRIDLVGGVGLK